MVACCLLISASRRFLFCSSSSIFWSFLASCWRREDIAVALQCSTLTGSGIYSSLLWQDTNHVFFLSFHSLWIEQMSLQNGYTLIHTSFMFVCIHMWIHASLMHTYTHTCTHITHYTLHIHSYTPIQRHTLNEREQLRLPHPLTPLLTHTITLTYMYTHHTLHITHTLIHTYAHHASLIDMYTHTHYTWLTHRHVHTHTYTLIDMYTHTHTHQTFTHHIHIHVHNSCMTRIGMHELRGRMHPNSCHATILLVVAVPTNPSHPMTSSTTSASRYEPIKL